MTVAELIEKLQEQQQDLPVVIEKGYMQDMELATSVSLLEGEFYDSGTFKRSGNYIFVG